MVLGVSADSVETQAKFKKKNNLPFSLLSDPHRRAVRAYGVWRRKSFMGKKFMGIERTTYLIDPQGKVKKVFLKVRSKGHPAQVLAALKEN